MNIKKINADSALYALLAFFSLWYFYFASSFVIRPYSQVFWGGMVIVTLYIAAVHNYRFSKIDKLYFGGMALLGILSIFSVDTYGSLSIILNYVIYYIVAIMISRNCNSTTIYRFIAFFSIVHLVCIFIQVYAPDFYLTRILPLLPPKRYSEILHQMKYNFAYYGFTVQSSMAAMYLSVGALFFAIKTSYSISNKKKIFFIIMTILFLIATFYTQRRGSSVIVLSIIALLYYKSEGNTLSKFFLVISVVLLIVVIGLENIPGLSGILDKFVEKQSQGALMSGREKNFEKALSSFYDKPIVGYGLGQIEKATGYAWVENSYLKILAECGIVGTIVYFLPYMILFKKTILKYKTKKNIYSEFALYVQVLFILMSVIENYYADPLTEFLLFVIVFTQENKKIEKIPPNL